MTFAATVLTLYPEMFPEPLRLSLIVPENAFSNGLDRDD